MPTLTITPPPCPGGSVPLDHNYCGTYDPAPLKPDTKSRVVVRLTLTTSSGTWTCDAPVVAGQWCCQFPGATAGAGTLSAVVVIDDVPQSGTEAVEDFDVLEVRVPTPCPMELRTLSPTRTAEAIYAAPPHGYAHGTFEGEYAPVGLNGPTVWIVCRVERRYPNPDAPQHYTRRFTVTTGLAVPLPNNRWRATILVPTSRPSGARDFFIAEFFNLLGMRNQGLHNEQLP